MTMTHKQQMLAVLRGQKADRIPWVPRLDLWYRANRRAETLPPRYAGASLFEMLDDLGFACHAVIPDFKALRSADDEAHRALGIYNLPCMPVRTVFDGINYRIVQDGDRQIVEYQTPAGPLTTVTVYDEAMRAAGVTITHVTKYAFSGPQDYEPLCCLFRSARVEPNYEGYAAMAGEIGERGFAAAYLSSAASPLHLIQRELMPLEVFFYELNDRPEEVHRLAECIAGYWRQMYAVAAPAPAEVFLLGANYHAPIQHPRFFAEHITPWLAEFAEILHRQGKFLLTHTDGENRGLLEQYLAAGIDVADSICPTPMTKLTLADTRRAFQGRITIMGGFPSVALVKDAMSDRQFAEYLDDFFRQLDRGDHLILGISDTTPPGAEFDRLLRIRDRIEAFGPVV
jgi:uroporphyrinogen-III decarboxylase